MVKKIVFFLFFVLITSIVCDAQSFIRTIDIITPKTEPAGSGQITINQDPAIDTLLSRNLLANKLKGGLDGFRIQVYRGNSRVPGQEASKEADKTVQKFNEEFPEIVSEKIFEKPNWYKVRVGGYRTKQEATKALYNIRRVFKDSYIVEETIEFPDLNK